MGGFVQWESIILAMIAFIILYLLLNKFAFGPLFSVMEERRERVLGDMNKAEESRKEAEKYLEEQKQAIQQAREEAVDIIEQAKKSAARQAESLVEQAREEAERLKADAVKEIDMEKKKALAELRGQVSSMSVLIASRIIEQQVDEEQHKQLIDKYLQEVGNIQ